jgi:hypothetical protein
MGWWVLVQALVRAVVIEVANVSVEDAAGVSFVVDQHPVGALGADAADEPFCVAVRLGRACRDRDHVDALGGEHGIEGIRELGIPVADQKTKQGGLMALLHLAKPGWARPLILGIGQIARVSSSKAAITRKVIASSSPSS